ncbi:MAG: ACP S-malonyltransferase [Fimbriimonadaceae bacterium]
MFAVVFPGQGSQKPGMGRDLEAQFPEARQVFDEASIATGEDLRHICFELDEATLRQTQHAQLALFTCGVAAWESLKPHIGAAIPHFMAGHSVGEYAALVAAGVLSLPDGARLVRERGRLMAEAGAKQPGAMAAVLGLELPTVEWAVERAQSVGVVAVANDNAPGQVVISGTPEAVQAASEFAKEIGAKRVLPLNVSGAFHSPLMNEPAEGFREPLRHVTFQGSPFGIQVVANVTAAPIDDPTEWPDQLVRQLASPVQWTQTMAYLAHHGVHFAVECGSGEVLCGLFKRGAPAISSAAAHDASSVHHAARIITEGRPT